jgi:hypothetical protein
MESDDRYSDSNVDGLPRSPRAMKRLGRRERVRAEELREQLKKELVEEPNAVKKCRLMATLCKTHNHGFQPEHLVEKR